MLMHKKNILLLSLYLKVFLFLIIKKQEKLKAWQNARLYWKRFTIECRGGKQKEVSFRIILKGTTGEVKKPSLGVKIWLKLAPSARDNFSHKSTELHSAPSSFIIVIHTFWPYTLYQELGNTSVYLYLYLKCINTYWVLFFFLSLIKKTDNSKSCKITISNQCGNLIDIHIMWTKSSTYEVCKHPINIPCIKGRLSTWLVTLNS